MKFTQLIGAALLSAHTISAKLNPGDAYQERQSSNVKFGDYAINLDDLNAGKSSQPRRELYDLQANYPEQFAMLVLAFNAFKSVHPGAPMSYHNIAALHGMPWGRNPRTMTVECTANPRLCQLGYAAHHSPAFMPWHRAYISLFEQQLRYQAMALAGPMSDKYQDAANKMRLPYWDWAKKLEAGQDYFPAMFTTDKITIKMPNGMQTVDNPFYEYRFPNQSQLGVPQDGGGLFLYNTTVRCPGKINGPGDGLNWTTVSDQQAVVSEFRSQADNFRRNIYGTFGGSTSQTTLLEFFTQNPLQNDTKPFPRVNTYANVEDVHNDVHLAVGGAWHVGQSNGTMSIITWSSYDPVFWLHHAQVDRIYNLYQGVYPGKRLESSPSQDSSWAFPQYTTIDMDSALRPFVATKGNNQVRLTIANAWNTTLLGYYYAEYEGISQATELQQKVIDQYYDPSAFVGTSSSAGRKRSVVSPLEPQEMYVAFAQLDTAKFRGTAKMYIFDGDTHNTTDPFYWKDVDNLLGRTNLMCNMHDKQRVQIAIDVNKIRAPGFNTVHIRPHLAHMAQVRIWAQTLDGTNRVFSPDELEGCHVKIVSIERFPDGRLGKPKLVKFIGHDEDNSRLLVGQYI